MSSPIVYSIYIPRILTSFTEEMIAYNFEVFQFGKVKRVDFAAIIEANGEEKKDIQNGSFKLSINQKNFWWLMKNKNPVSETKMNIHQIVENARLLSERVEKQEKIIEDLVEKIAALESKLSKSPSPKVPYTLKNPDEIIGKPETVVKRIVNSEDLCGNK